MPAGSVIPKNAARDLALMSRGSYGSSGDVQDHILFDTIPFAATTVRPTTSFFTTPQGGAYTSTTTKGIQETNMTDPGKLPAGQSFLMKEISFSALTLINATDVDAMIVSQALANIMFASVIEIRIAGREFDFQVPGSVFYPSWANYGRATMVDATDRSFSLGSTVASGWIKLGTPIPLGEMVSFSIVQRTASAVAANQTIINTASDVLATQVAGLQCRLKGTLTRSK
jgi:hypothetical protein